MKEYEKVEYSKFSLTHKRELAYNLPNEHSLVGKGNDSCGTTTTAFFKAKPLSSPYGFVWNGLHGTDHGFCHLWNRAF
ncbi:hypothetical protein BRIN106911_09420 [Brevibacillus invocatus]